MVPKKMMYFSSHSHFGLSGVTFWQSAPCVFQQPQPKSAPERYQKSPLCSKNCPRATLLLRPSMSSKSSKSDPMSSKSDPRSFKRDSGSSTSDSRSSKSYPRSSKSDPGSSKSDPRSSKSDPRSPSSGLRSSKSYPGSSKRLPQERKKWFHEAPKVTPTGLTDEIGDRIYWTNLLVDTVLIGSALLPDPL